MHDQQPYHFGVIDIPCNEELLIPGQEQYEKIFTWDASAAGFADVTQDNIMVMAAVFNSEVHQGYAYPPSGNPFDAYYVDAAAAATPGKIGYNFKNLTFSHTVFVEEGTATWCQYCPAMAHALYRVYQSQLYPFYFVALIDDKCPDASNRVRQDYNIAGFPTAFFDGGYKVLVGGDSNDNSYKTRIRQCSERDVPPLNMSVAVEWLGGGDLSISIHILSQDESEDPLIIESISGGLRVAASIRNNATYQLTDLAWNISVTGGLFHLIDSYTSGTIALLEPGTHTEIQSTDPVLGLGPVNITVTVSMEGLLPLQQRRTGFALGPFILAAL